MRKDERTARMQCFKVDPIHDPTVATSILIEQRNLT
jgi:hypothetical protein